MVVVPPRFSRLSLPLIAAGWLLAAPGHGHAQAGPRGAAAGGRLAQQYCSQCHVVTPSDQTGWTSAPSFEAIANRKGVTAAGLSTFIQQPQPAMLHTNRPRDEADALAAYIMSLHRN